ncbi:MAG: PilZ domain-containing protein [Deltaproteobacteria bacterium]|nr:PilZ domain-containing protein [Deltaproteobacteria bacterium]
MADADPVLRFFESLGRAFRPKVELARDVELGLLALVLFLLLLFFSRPLRRRIARARRFRALLDERGLGRADRRQVEEIADEAGTDPLSVVERREEFERATARALQRPGQAGTPPLVHRLRHAFFDLVPQSAPLLSSRELHPGALLAVGALPARVTAVTEEVLAVALQGDPHLAPGDTASVALSRGREARYQLRCQVRSVEQASPDGFIVQLQHDEAPERIQARAAVRVPVHTGVGLTRLAPGGAGEEEAALLGELVDLSNGGALVATRARVSPGEHFFLSFSAGGARFEKVRADLLWVEPLPSGGCHAHLAFGALEPAVGSRLEAAVATLDLRRQAERKFGPEG